MEINRIIVNPQEVQKRGWKIIGNTETTESEYKRAEIIHIYISAFRIV